ncbi:hypothetical protein Tco_1037992 [Tanacetum coccineum]
MINKKKVSLDVDMFREILQICPKILGQEFEDVPLEQDILFFIRDLGHTRDITYLTDVNVDYLHQSWRAFATVINKCLSGKETRIDKIRLSFAYYDIASGEKTPKLKYVRKKADSDTSPKQKPVQATKGTRIKSKANVAKSDKKKQPTKKPKAKGLAILSEVALTEDLTLSNKRSDEGTSRDDGAYEGYMVLYKGVPDVPIYESESEKESWGDSEDEDNKNNSDDISDEGHDDNDGNDGNDDDDDDDANDDDKQEGDDTNDDDEETDSDRTESDRIKIPILDQSTTEYYEEEERFDDEEMMNDDEDDEVTKELYEDVNVNLGYEDTEMTNADQGASKQQNKADEPIQSSSVSSNFTSKLLNLDNPSPSDIEIASLMETSARHATTILENTFNSMIESPTWKKDMSEINQVDQYAQALSSIPAIVDRYMDNKLGEAINKDIQAHNLDCRQEAQDEMNTYIELVDTSMIALIKEEVNTQLPQILPQVVSDFANPVIEKNVTELVEAAVLTMSSSQPTSNYEVAASLSEYCRILVIFNTKEQYSNLERESRWEDGSSERK